jgi:HAD superfamily hydrolase (TIGR01490 family)
VVRRGLWITAACLEVWTTKLRIVSDAESAEGSTATPTPTGGARHPAPRTAGQPAAGSATADQSTAHQRAVGSAPSNAPAGSSADAPSGCSAEATGRPAAFFDLDKTIIAKSSTLAFSRPFHAGGLINRRSVLRSAYAQFVFALQGADHDQMEKMRAYLSTMCAGWSVQTVRDIVAETLHSTVEPLVYDEAMQLIHDHQVAGRDVIIVSSSGAEVVEPIGELLGADHVIATRMVVRDGLYTGEIAFYAYAEGKADAIRKLASTYGYDLAASYAYSDSETDRPLLEAVGHPHAVNPDRALRRIADERGWPVLRFSRPVGLQRRVDLDTTTGKTAIAMAVIAAAGTAGVLAWRLRRSKVRA